MAAQATTDKTLERRVRQLLLLQETAKKVNSILDLEQLLDEIVGGVAEAFGCNRTAILLKDNSTNDLVMIALRGFSNVHLKGYRFRVGGEGMVGHVSATAKMRYAPDVRSDPYYMVSEATTLSEVDIPLISRGKLIGEDSITIEERYCRGDWSVPKTDASAATIGVDPTVIARLDRLKDLMVEVRAGRAVRKSKVVKSAGPDDLVFQSVKDGRPMGDQNILKRHIQPAARKLGLPFVNWQCLRTSHATWMILAGADPKSVQGQMRHSRVSTTMEIYAQIVPAGQRRAVEQLSEFASRSNTVQ